jgi:hypothetical protein
MLRGGLTRITDFSGRENLVTRNLLDNPVPPLQCRQLLLRRRRSVSSIQQPIRNLLFPSLLFRTLSFQRSASTIQDPLFPCSRSTAYVILSSQAPAPSSVWLRGTTPTGDELKLEINVQHVVKDNGETIHQHNPINKDVTMHGKAPSEPPLHRTLHQIDSDTYSLKTQSPAMVHGQGRLEH